MRQDVRGLTLDDGLHPEEVLPQLRGGRLRVAEEDFLEGGQVFGEPPGGLAGLAQVRGDIGGAAAAAIVGGDAGQAGGPIRLVAGQQHLPQRLLNGFRGGAGRGLERGDLGGAEIQGLAGLGARQRPCLVSGDLQAREVRQGSGAADLTVGLHLGIGADEVARHELLADGVRRRLVDQEGDGERQVSLGYPRQIGGDELPVQDALLVGGGQPHVRQHLIGARLSVGPGRDTEQAGGDHREQGRRDPAIPRRGAHRGPLTSPPAACRSSYRCGRSRTPTRPPC